MENPFQKILERLEAIDERMAALEKRMGGQSNVGSDALLDIDELSAFTKMPKGTIYRKVHRGELPCIRRTRYLLFMKKDILNWLEEGRVPTKTEAIRKAKKHMGQ